MTVHSRMYSSVRPDPDVVVVPPDPTAQVVGGLLPLGKLAVPSRKVPDGVTLLAVIEAG